MRWTWAGPEDPNVLHAASYQHDFAKRSALNHEQKFTRWLSVAQEQAPGVR